MRAIFVGCFEPTCFDFEFHDVLKYIKQKKNIPSNTTRAMNIWQNKDKKYYLLTSNTKDINHC